jgi:hypothetical protein
MDDALQVVSEMNEHMWRRFKNALEDLGEEELHWQPLPQANTINLIVRHLSIEAQWHLDSLERGEPMPTIAVSAAQEVIDAVSTEFEDNFKKLEDLYTRFVEMLRKASRVTLQQRTAASYGKANATEGRTYLLGYHQATHLAMHCGQIQMIRNCTARREESRPGFSPTTRRIPNRVRQRRMPATKSVTAFGSPCNSRRARRTQRLVSVDLRSCG